MSKIFLVFFFLISLPLTATQFYEMDTTVLLPCKLSTRHHNRILITGDRIKKVFFQGGTISASIEEESGQLFIQALADDIPETTISIVSNSGYVQDLEFSFEDRQSEIIILNPKKSENLSTLNMVCIDEEAIQEIVDGFLQGSIPPGFVAHDDEQDSCTIKKGIQAKRLARLVGIDQIVFVYRLENTSRCLKSLTECEANLLDGDWVFLDRYNFRPKECGLALIGVNRS